MENELENSQTMKEVERDVLQSDSSCGSSLLNLNCDSNLLFESDEASLRTPDKENSNIDGNTAKKPVDFANLDDLLAERTGGGGDTDSVGSKGIHGVDNMDDADCNEDGVRCEVIEDVRGAGDGNEEQVQEKDGYGVYNSVQIMTIQVPDDDDLFDFKRDTETEMEATKFEGNLENTELYKYLTEQDVARLKSLEVTPCQSRGDSGESEESEESDGYTSASSSEGAPSSEVTPQKYDVMDSSSSHQEETPVKSLAQPVRRRPGRKPQLPATQANKKPSKSAGLSAKTLDKLEKSKQVTEKWIKDLSIPDNLSFNQRVRLDILELNQYLTCGLCKGYLYEASTVTECMHTFCKNCIVRHCMEVSLHCPVCSILIHPTDPFVNIRLDRMIQDIVYKLLPTVAETEMERIKAFYAEHPEVQPREIQAPPPKPKVSPKEKEQKEKAQSPMVSLLLETEGESESVNLEKKFLRVTSRATIANVCTFLRHKLELTDMSQVELYCCGDAVEDNSCTLENIKNKFFGQQDCLMLMQYRVRDS